MLIVGKALAQGAELWYLGEGTNGLDLPSPVEAILVNSLGLPLWPSCLPSAEWFQVWLSSHLVHLMTLCTWCCQDCPRL